MMGRGMMGSMGKAVWALDLNSSQRAQILKIQDDMRRKNWELMGRAQDEAATLRDAYLVEGKPDRKVLMAAYKRIGELRLQRIDNALEAADRVDGVLTAPQREQLKRTMHL